MSKKLLTALFMAALSLQLGAYEYFMESGDYRVRISAKFKHTIRQIVWKKFEIGRPTGYYGAILVPKPGKFIGAGHTEGGMEEVLAVKIDCDGKSLEPAPRLVLKGKKITVDKISRFANLLFNIRLELTPEGLIETKRFVALAEQKIHLFYAHIYCFNKSFTDYYALSDTGKVISGKFSLPKLDKLPKDRKNLKKAWHVRSDVRYTSEYDAAAKKGVLLYYPQVIKGKLHKSTFWEVPYAYMKYYMVTDVPGVVPANWESPTYTVAVRCFEAATIEEMPQAVKDNAEIASKFQYPALAKPELPKK